MSKITWSWMIALVAWAVVGWAVEQAPDDVEIEPFPATEEVMPQPGEIAKFTATNSNWTAPDYSGQDKNIDRVPVE